MNTSSVNRGITCKTKSHRLRIINMLYLHLLIQLALSSHALASGVVELELVSMRFLGAAPKRSAGDPFRLGVCLKEAFASQLDGPCAYGNASVTLDELEPKTDRSNTGAKSNTSQAGEKELAARGEAAENQTAQVANIVRIPFSFRWTKSFTIVLTAERQAEKFTENILRQVSTERATNLEISANRSQSETETGNGLALIDRHVFTENEVLPSWGPNNKAAWITRFSRSFKTSLVYRFRILCASNYYGDDCATFCRPRDDQFGHFQCTPIGQKVCMEGWHGADCSHARCSASCNKQHGFCDQPDTCQCRPGWTGPRCDECLTYPGCQNGFCLSPWQCVCQSNWTGVLCDQDLNFCGSHSPCQNDAICLNAGPGRYKCLCPPGFTGLNCQLKLTTLVEPDTILSTRLHAAGCSQNPCLNNGLCLRVGQPLAVATTTITSAPKDPERAADSGTVQQNDIQVASQPYRCQCPTGFTGDYCQWSDFPAKENRSNISPGSSNDDSQPVGDEISNQRELDSASAFRVGWDVNASTNESRLASESPPEILLQPPFTPPPHIEMRHLISGVVVASAIGVFCAALLLAWCCLLAIERGKFQMVQMNFICGANDVESNEIHGSGFASGLRRVQAKIRDSFRRSARTSIKPETKLSLDNVLNPARMAPPSYEESNQAAEERIEQEFAALTKSRPHIAIREPPISGNDAHLVRQGALEQQLALKKKSARTNLSSRFDHEPAQCPRHGHLYRNSQAHIDIPTTIEIEYQPTNTNR